MISLLTLSFRTDDSDQGRAYDQYNQGGVSQEHEASFSHELIAGAASYEAAKAYENHCERNGKDLNPWTPVCLPIWREYKANVLLFND